MRAHVGRRRDDLTDDGDIDHHLARRCKEKIGVAGFMATHGTAPRAAGGGAPRVCAVGLETRGAVGLLGAPKGRRPLSRKQPTTPESFDRLGLTSLPRTSPAHTTGRLSHVR